MPTHHRSALIILFISLATFANTLSHEFVGDDHFLIVHNTFYATWTNFPELFTPRYIMDSDEAFNSTNFSHTGSVAYRPVLSATFFLDYWLWNKNPWGYHFFNLLLHILNAILVYCILVSILQKDSLALWSALLFAVHPLKTEAVCAIGYRADSLACFFLLLAFWAYIKFRDYHGVGRRVLQLGMHLSLILALFTKESTIVFLGLVMAFDWLIQGEKIDTVLKHLVSRYLGFVLITCFYVYVYAYLFRNSTFGAVHLMGGSWSNHIAMMLRIAWLYLETFLWPPLVKGLPPVYTPPADFLPGVQVLFPLGLVVVFIYIYGRWRRVEPRETFFILWFLLSYIPVSNIIPLANPMAYRFMYIPSIGLLTVIAILIDKAVLYLQSNKIDAGKILRLGVVALCVVITIPLNMAWRNNLTMASQMVRDFPANPTGYLHLGIAYYDHGALDKAQLILQKGFERGLDDPRGYYYMGLCLLNDFKRSRPYYEKSIYLFPKYALAYIGLGRIELFEGAYERAIPYLEKALHLTPSYTAYGYLIQSHLLLGRDAEARAILRQAEASLTDERYLSSLRILIEDPKSRQGPVDIGL